MEIEMNQINESNNKSERIRKQIEFYLSDSNVRKDKYIQSLLAGEDDKLNDRKYIGLEEFLKFNRIKQLTQEIDDLKSALQNSELLELSGDRLSVRRKRPIDFNKNIDKCTVYVEKLSAQIDHDWLKDLFSQFGCVVHVSLPRYKENKEHKGFAFVEFENEKTAQETCEFFNRLAIAKERLESSESNESDGLLIDELLENISKTNQNEDLVSFNEKSLSVDENNKNTMVTSKDDIDDDGQKFRNILQEFKEKYTTKIDQLILLRVISKGKWLAYKREYLKLQRKLEYRKEKSKSTSKASETDETMEPKAKRDKPERQVKMEPGLIVKLEYVKSKLPEEESLIKKILREIDGDAKTIAYIDLKTEHHECFIRFKDKESALVYSQRTELNELGKVTIIEGLEEKNYWSTIMQSMLNQIKKKSHKNDHPKSQPNKTNETQDTKNGQEHPQHDKRSLDDFKKGLIIRLQMDINLNNEPSEQELKKQIKNSTNGAYIAYIDQNTSIHNLFLSSELVRKTIFIRTKSAECTKKVLEDEKFKNLGETSVLEGDEEFEYWQHIKECSQAKKHPQKSNRKSN